MGNHEAAGGYPQNAGGLVVVFPVIDSRISNDFALHTVVSLNFMSISFTGKCYNFCTC